MTDKLSCGCCDSVQQAIAEHIDPSGTIEAGDDPEVVLARINEMYATTPEGHSVTLDDVTSYIRSMRGIEEDRVCPECYSNVRCDCA